ncbi:hypothetical protein [Microbacterium tumbae]
MNADVRRARTAFLWVGVIVPAAIVALSAIIIAAWLPEVPEPAAIHWGFDGVDGYGPGWTYLALLLGIGGGIVVLFAVMAFLGHRLPPRSRSEGRPDGPQWSPTARFLGAMSLGVSTLLAATSLISVGVQRGLADAAETPDITPWVILGIVLMAGLAVLGWFLQPAAYTTTDAGVPAGPLELAGTERAVWMGTASTARGAQIVLGVAVFFVLATAALLGARGVEGWWFSAIIGIALAVLAATMLVFRVRVNAAGLQVRSAVGWPRFAIPASDVASVRVVTVNPFGEFGGWGYRIGLDGRRGVVLRGGEALQVEQRNGKVFVVTVDDAATAASVLVAASGISEGTEGGAS